jgi:hypothetical protein
MDQDAKGENKRSRGTWPLLILFAFALWQVGKTAYAALHRPWTWTMDQVLFVFFAACLVVGLCTWSSLWWRGGTAAVKRRWMWLAEETIFLDAGVLDRCRRDARAFLYLAATTWDRLGPLPFPPPQ